jgi:hypothetical protein
MLFDLRGRGRRRTVKVIYLALALLLGGSLVGFGIGSNTSGGGLVDALLGKDGGGSGTSPDKTLDKQAQNAVKDTRLRPRDPLPWAKLSGLRFQRANAGGGFQSATGRKQLVLATQAWERYVALDPKRLDEGLALQMTQAYGISGLNQPLKAFRAMRIVTAETKPPNSNLYQQLAVLAYYAHQTTTGDLAADRAVQLAPAAMRKQLRAGLKQAKADPLSVLRRLNPVQPSG